ncbi:MAG: ATP-dependent helicase HrpB, partial [Acidimicrobiia bacterium]|nr:ATP-dependent helicase HrpB [Acidimicrobiia bacterium]
LVMSATIDAEGVAGFLSSASESKPPVPVITAQGRSHPVDIRWQPPRGRIRMDDHVAGLVRTALDTEPSGDVLVFLPGMGEINRVAERLDNVLAEVHRLHGSLPPSDQDRAISPPTPPFRKVVLSTDIAETSITVEGVRVVIDSGMARSPRYDARTGMTRLTTIPISRASADQRAGRAGRIEPGVAIRAWSRLEHGARPPQIEPEITQVDLAGFMLELAAWGISDPAELPFLEPPPPRSVEEALLLLTRLGALDDRYRLTETGRAMVGLPVHPRLARMVVDAEGDGTLACILATLIDERDPMRGRPDEVPVDISLRVRAITDRGFGHQALVGPAVFRLRDRARELCDRAGVGWGPVDTDRIGPVLALAYPDRLAVRRGSPGRFQLRIGTSAFTPPRDTLAPEQFLVVADLDGRRKDTRIRLAAGIDPADVLTVFSHQIDHIVETVWDGDRLVDRTRSQLGALVLEETTQRVAPGAATTQAIIEKIRERGLGILPLIAKASELRTRVAYLRETLGEDWPDWSDQNLRDTLESWLAPYLREPRGLDDLKRIDLVTILRSQLPYPQSVDIDRQAPTHITVPSGRRRRVDYSGETPTLTVRVQDMYGSTKTPLIGGKPMTLDLVSPANRTVQITSDLAGFWEDSYQEVRKEMAGRYPKHSWPQDPVRAKPEVKG